MKIIGLTGGVAMGKSTVSKMIQALGHAVVDADVLAREVVEPGSFGLQAVKTYFGPEIIKNKKLDRETLRKRIVADPDEKLLLERVLHPLIQWRAQEEFKVARGENKKLVFYDAPLIYEKGLEKNLDFVIVVHTTPEIQVARLMKRDNLSQSEAQKLIDMQMPIEDKVKRTSWLIDNSQEQRKTKEQVSDIVQRLLSGSKPPRNS